MTRDEFLAHFTKHADEVQWALYGTYCIRTADGKHCPISYVASKIAGYYGNYSNPYCAGGSQYLQMNYQDVTTIAVAADNENHHPAIRKILLETTKLPPQA